MDEATQSYRERMKAQRAEARAKRDADKAEWHRRIELHVEVRRIAMAAVKATIRDRGDKLSLYSLAQLRAQANGMIGPWLVAQAKARIDLPLNFHPAAFRASTKVTPFGAVSVPA